MASRPTSKASLSRTDRRTFLATSAGALALGVPAVGSSRRSANDRINVGLIGCGSRGGTLLNWTRSLADSHNVRVTAVCDIWNRRREQAERNARTKFDNPVAACATLGELLDRTDVDAVLIATADFQHCYHAALAVQAGKDVYVEKPFGCDWEQVRQARAVIAASDRVMQIGTQSRGDGKYAAAARFVQSGKLGQVTYIEISEPIFQQRWRIPGSETSLTADEVNWAEFLAYLPQETPFNARHFREFRLFWPYSTGPFCQWMSHRLDLVNLILGKWPKSAVAQGGTYLWQDGRNTPDTVQALFEYPNRVLVSYHLRMGNSMGGRGMTIYGTAGTLDVEEGIAHGNGGGGLVIEGEAAELGRQYVIDATRRLKAKKAGGIPIVGESFDYLGHFFDSVRNRTRPVGDVEAAYGMSIATLLAHDALRTGRRASYDAATDSCLLA